ncbi:MAG: biotin--[acetyl-CoA-carboxylase] ligase [Chloroflexota bacterium]|nr:biotin--[acetyl-CoA-carboxylase] ligase [Chloroflexota bacterium]
MSRRIIGRRIVRFDTIGSTMDEAARLGDDGEPEGTIVTAAEQSAGRGRGGRAWLAPPRTALLCSVLLRPAVPPARLPVLSLVIGVATAEAIEATTGLSCHLKWPNDIWLGQDDAARKVSGILVTSRLTAHGIAYAVAGVGINVNARPEALPPEATSLRAATGTNIDPETLLASLIDRLNHAYDAYRASNGRPGLDDWRQRAALLGEPVSVQDGDTDHLGMFAGIDHDGALLLVDASGRTRRIIAGELTRGPRSLPLA